MGTFGATRKVRAINCTDALRKLHLDENPSPILLPCPVGMLMYCAATLSTLAWLASCTAIYAHRGNLTPNKWVICPILYAGSKSPKTNSNSLFKRQWCPNSITSFKMRLQLRHKIRRSLSVHSPLLYGPCENSIIYRWIFIQVVYLLLAVANCHSHTLFSFLFCMQNFYPSKSSPVQALIESLMHNQRDHSHM